MSRHGITRRCRGRESVRVKGILGGVTLFKGMGLYDGTVDYNSYFFFNF